MAGLPITAPHRDAVVVAVVGEWARPMMGHKVGGRVVGQSRAQCATTSG